VCELFTSADPRVSHRLDVMDMRKCVEILVPQLDRVPPPVLTENPIQPFSAQRNIVTLSWDPAEKWAK
jgi:hypothetical protein